MKKNNNIITVWLLISVKYSDIFERTGCIIGTSNICSSHVFLGRCQETWRAGLPDAHLYFSSCMSLKVQKVTTKDSRIPQNIGIHPQPPPPPSSTFQQGHVTGVWHMYDTCVTPVWRLSAVTCFPGGDASVHLQLTSAHPELDLLPSVTCGLES